MPVRKKRLTKKTIANRILNWKRFWTWLQGKECVDCGEDDACVLEMDHVRGKKIDSVTSLIWKGRAWSTILKEMRKCEVRCCNCHRRVTAKRLGWKRAE